MFHFSSGFLEQKLNDSFIGMSFLPGHFFCVYRVTQAHMFEVAYRKRECASLMQEARYVIHHQLTQKQWPYLGSPWLVYF